jgi:hypothetical protein
MPIFFAYVRVPAPADGVLIVSVRVLEYLCCLCGRHVACLLLSVIVNCCKDIIRWEETTKH